MWLVLVSRWPPAAFARPRSAARRSHPEPRARVLQDRGDVVVADGVDAPDLRAVAHRATGLRIESVQPAGAGADPERSAPVGHDRRHIVVAQARRIRRILPEALRDLPRRGEALEPPFARANPEPPFRILADGGHPARTDARRIGRVVTDRGGLPAREVQPQQLDVGSDPELALGCIRDREEGLLREAGDRPSRAVAIDANQLSGPGPDPGAARSSRGDRGGGLVGNRGRARNRRVDIVILNSFARGKLTAAPAAK